MISAGDFRNGVTLEIDGQVVQILEFQHVKPGKGAAFVRTKLKNVINGGVVERTFRPTEKFPQARIERVDMQYLYSDGDLFYFMNVENYEQIALNEETIGDALKFVKENEMVKVCSYNGNVFAIEPPLFVELEITETEPGFKGDTAQGASKPATVETGATVSVPLFVNQGDKIKIDTRTGEYLSRVYDWLHKRILVHDCIPLITAHPATWITIVLSQNNCLWICFLDRLSKILPELVINVQASKLYHT